VDLAALSTDSEVDRSNLAAASTPVVIAKVAQGLPDAPSPANAARSSDLPLSTDDVATAVTLPLPERTKAGMNDSPTTAVGALRNEISAWQTPAIGNSAAAPVMAPISSIQLDGLTPQQTDFVDKLATQMQWMGQQKIQRAELELHPAELGRLDITLELEGQSLRAEFGSSHAEVRAAIESQLPRLRDLLAAQGFQLGDAQVGSQQRESRSTFASTTASLDMSVSDAPVSEPQPVPVRRVSAGRLDEFA
jgi:flagellar hook-length control protein FliK